MIRRKVKIINPSGLHLRPAAVLCNKASEFDSSISFVYNETESNAKSILSVLSACVKRGEEIELVCKGQDEEKAMEALIAEINNGLGE